MAFHFISNVATAVCRTIDLTIASQNRFSIFPVTHAKEADVQDTLLRHQNAEWIRDLVSRTDLIEKARIPQDVRIVLGYKGKSFLSDDDRVCTKYYYDPKLKSVTGFAEFSKDVEGPQGYVHGGCISAVVDELFGRTVMAYLDPDRAVTVNLSIQFRKFVELESLLMLKATIEKQEGRKIFVKGTVINPETGTVHVEATGIFVLLKKN